jgi:hypothetical protein
MSSRSRSTPTDEVHQPRLLDAKIVGRIAKVPAVVDGKCALWLVIGDDGVVVRPTVTEKIADYWLGRTKA